MNGEESLPRVICIFLKCEKKNVILKRYRFDTRLKQIGLVGNDFSSVVFLVVMFLDV